MFSRINRFFKFPNKESVATQAFAFSRFKDRINQILYKPDDRLSIDCIFQRIFYSTKPCKTSHRKPRLALKIRYFSKFGNIIKKTPN